MRSQTIIPSLLLITTFALSSCGIRGSLETAPPVFGPAKAKYEAEKAQKAEEERKAQEKTNNSTPKQ
jgi:hypothetical protein